jgi:hypothetical protein
MMSTDDLARMDYQLRAALHARHRRGPDGQPEPSTGHSTTTLLTGKAPPPILRTGSTPEHELPQEIGPRLTLHPRQAELCGVTGAEEPHNHDALRGRPRSKDVEEEIASGLVRFRRGKGSSQKGAVEAVTKAESQALAAESERLYIARLNCSRNVASSSPTSPSSERANQQEQS